MTAREKMDEAQADMLRALQKYLEYPHESWLADFDEAADRYRSWFFEYYREEDDIEAAKGFAETLDLESS